MPKYTAIVYTMQMAIRIAIVKAGVSGIPVTRLKAMDKRGVAREKVVAVPANRANTAVRSMMRPKSSIYPLSQNRTAGFGVFLTVPFPDMEHKAKGNS